MTRVWRPVEEEALGHLKTLTAAEIKKNLARRRAKKEIIQTAEAGQDTENEEGGTKNGLEVAKRVSAFEDRERGPHRTETGTGSG